MKHLFLLLLLAMVLPAAQAQSLSADMAKQQQAKAGELLIKSSTDLYISGGLAVVSAGVFIAASTVDQTDESSPKNLLMAIGGITGAGALAFYVMHIVHLNQAGNVLKYNSKKKPAKIALKVDNSGVGLAYRFK